MLTYDLFSVSEEMIKGENLTEVTSSKIFIREGEPDPEGLASYEIFGYPGTAERKKHFAYIELNDVFVHPHCQFELKSIKRQFMDLINGVGEYYIKNGDLVKVEGAVPAGAVTGTGARFLFDNWEKLKFDDLGQTSGVRFNRLRFIKSLDKSQIFMNKILVIPPFYRDVDMSGDKKNEINTIYISLMNLASTIKSTENILGTFDNVSDTYRTMNTILVDFHEMMIKMYGGRKGFIHKYIMGKAIDYSARLVISCLDISKADSPNLMDATFNKSMVPLFAVIKCFAPFIVNGIREIIEEYMSGGEYVFVNKDTNSSILNFGKMHNRDVSDMDTEKLDSVNSGLKIERVKLASDWKVVLTSQYIYNLIELYHDAPEHRLDPFKLPLEDGGEVTVQFYVNDGADIDIEQDIAKAKTKLVTMRLIHLFYMAAYDKVRNKHVYITRYPIEDHNNTYPSGLNIVPYNRVGSIMIGDTVYPNFPIIDTKKDFEVVTSMFTDSLVIFPAFLSALGGDFDGDMVSMIGVFTKEANADANTQIFNVGNMTAIDGGTTRKLGTLAQHVIHAMTY